MNDIIQIGYQDTILIEIYAVEVVNAIGIFDDRFKLKVYFNKGSFVFESEGIHEFKNELEKFGKTIKIIQIPKRPIKITNEYKKTFSSIYDKKFKLFDISEITFHVFNDICFDISYKGVILRNDKL